MAKISGIYLITNTANGKCYVGSSNNIKGRWHRHRGDLRSGTHPNPKLQNSWSKWGEEHFTFTILEVVEDLGQLIPIEEKYVLTLNPAYNCKLPSEGGKCYPTPESRARIAEKLKGRKFTQEHRDKISAANRKRVYTQETRDKIGAYSKTRVHTEETKAKIGAKSKGHTISPETRQKMSNSQKGKHSMKPEDNPRYDHTEYTFHNITTQESFTGTRYYFGKIYGIGCSYIGHLLKGKILIHKGWMLD